MFQEKRFAFDAENFDSHSFLEGDTEDIAYAAQPEGNLADSFTELEDFDNQAEFTPTDQGIGFINYQVTTPGTLGSIIEDLRANAEALFGNDEPRFRILDESGTEIETGLFPNEDLTLDSNYTIETSRFSSEEGRDFAQQITPNEDFMPREDTISYTVTENTTLQDMIANGFMDEFIANHYGVLGQSGFRHRFVIEGPDGQRITRGDLEAIQGADPERLAQFEIPAGSQLRTRVYTQAPERQEEPEFDYAPEEFDRWANVALELTPLQQRLISPEFAENPDRYSSEQVVNLVAEYQARNNLEVDGKAGESTLAQLNEQTAHFEIFDNIAFPELPSRTDILDTLTAETQYQSDQDSGSSEEIL